MYVPMYRMFYEKVTQTSFVQITTNQNFPNS